VTFTGHPQPDRCQSPGFGATITHRQSALPASRVRFSTSRPNHKQMYPRRLVKSSAKPPPESVKHTSQHRLVCEVGTSAHAQSKATWPNRLRVEADYPSPPAFQATAGQAHMLALRVAATHTSGHRGTCSSRCGNGPRPSGVSYRQTTSCSAGRLVPGFHKHPQELHTSFTRSSSP
jgi:hypothetical protein